MSTLTSWDVINKDCLCFRYRGFRGFSYRLINTKTVKAIDIKKITIHYCLMGFYKDLQLVDCKEIHILIQWKRNEEWCEIMNYFRM